MLSLSSDSWTFSASNLHKQKFITLMSVLFCSMFWNVTWLYLFLGMDQFYHMLLSRLTKIFHKNLSFLVSMCKSISILPNWIYFDEFMCCLSIMKEQNGSISVVSAQTAEGLDHLNKLTATLRCSTVSFTWIMDKPKTAQWPYAYPHYVLCLRSFDFVVSEEDARIKLGDDCLTIS